MPSQLLPVAVPWRPCDCSLTAPPATSPILGSCSPPQLLAQPGQPQGPHAGVTRQLWRLASLMSSPVPSQASLPPHSQALSSRSPSCSLAGGPCPSAPSVQEVSRCLQRCRPQPCLPRPLLGCPHPGAPAWLSTSCSARCRWTALRSHRDPAGGWPLPRAGGSVVPGHPPPLLALLLFLCISCFQPSL